MKQRDYEVVWPRGRRVTQSGGLAKRLDNLDGKTIAAIWDWLFFGDVIFPTIREELARRYPRSKFVDYEAFGSSHFGHAKDWAASLPEKLRKHGIDAVISGVGC